MSKPFTLILSELNEGADANGLTQKFSDLLSGVMNAGKSGKLTITVSVVPATKNKSGGVDKVNVSVDAKVKLPEHVSPADFFYLTEDGQLSRNHPRQQSLELKDVSGSGVVSENNLKKVS